MSFLKRVAARVRHLARRFGTARALCVLLLGVLVAIRVADPVPLEELRLRTFDLFQIVKPRDDKFRPVVIVDIDEKSIARLGQWPWSRTVIADLVNRLKAADAAAVAFDVIFPEPDRMSPGVLADAYRNLDDATRERLKKLPSNDEVFAQALRGSRVVLGVSGLPNAAQQSPQPLPLTGLATLGSDPAPFLFDFPGLLRNVPVLEQAATARGMFTIKPERDGIIRRVPVVLRAQDAVVPSLSFEMIRLVAGSDTIFIKADQAGLKSVAVPGFEVPTDRNGQLWVYFAKHDMKRYVSAVDVLEGRVGPDALSRKLVLIGTSATGLLDIKTTPLDPVMPGVEVHAQVLENVLTRSVLSRPNVAVAVELFAAILVSLLIIWLAPIFGPLALLISGAVVALISVGVSWYYFVYEKLLFDFTFPMLTTFSIFLVITFFNYASEQAKRRQIRSAFGQYLSPALVEQLANSPDRLKLGGEEREMTVMFSDVRGFTTISESFKSDPQGLTSLMNRFLTPLTNAIIDRKGTIDKYMGDAIMAFWNAPLDDPAHPVNACNAALDMIERIEALNIERQREAEESGKPFIPMHVGIGLNTGVCVVGNMGSDLRFDYSVLGDSVNLASRLEGQSKSYGVPIIVGSKTAMAVKDKFAILELDFITVKGKKEPEVIYAIAGREDVANSGKFQRARNLNIEMLAHYRSQKWEEALLALDKARLADEGGSLATLYDLYESRIRDFIAQPPPPDWDGVFALQTK
ncbi:MAG: CHASE2 domain-containing protein [Pseudomonadota bacterium]